MPSYPPTTDEILDRVARYLREEVLPASEGFAQFRVRVAAAELDLVRRESESRGAREAAERNRLQALLDSGEDSLPTLNRRLRDELRSGAMSWRDAALTAHIRETIHADLSVDNPRWFRDDDEA
ncbi:MAG: DUF6285 domain-containing protein [Alphaproteobacteria bacterium]|jgi:hypothetical protein|nr:DUF6285 domain-containing protein [Alphaproteobacteria bacterium]